LKKAASQRSKEREAPRSTVARPARLKTRRRQKRIVTTLACLLGAVALFGALGAATHLQQLAVSGVSVAGAERLPADSLVSAVQGTLEESGFRLFSRKNVLLYPKSAIESELAADFPRIKEVTVARESLLASALVVTVEERKPYATWCAASCYVFDARGFIFAEKAETPEKSYVFYGGLRAGEDPISQTFLEGRLTDVVAFLDALGTAGFPAESFAVESEKDFTVQLGSGQRILASFDMPYDGIIRNLTTALEDQALKEKFGSLEYLDLRFGNKVYYK
jgi:hypothetical protein